MDILAHGLWTNAVFDAAARRKSEERSKRDTWLSIFFGVAPDLFSFGIYFIINLFTSGTLWPYAQARLHSEWGKEVAIVSKKVSARWMDGALSAPDPSLIPNYVHTLYDITHSLVIFAAIFLFIWLVRRRAYWLFAGWGFHILIDIFSHSDKFFPTPILFPFSNFHFDGISWAEPVFMLINYSLLIVVYLWLYVFRRRKKIVYSQ